MFSNRNKRHNFGTPHPSQALRAVNGGVKFLSRAATGNELITLFDQAIASGTNFLTGVIIGRLCSKEQFGLYMLGFSIVLFITNTQVSFISTPYTVYVPRLKGKDASRYTGSTLIHQLGYSALTIAGLFIGGAALSLTGDPNGLAPVIWALAGAITFILLREYIRRICFALLQTRTVLCIDAFVAIVQITGLLLLARNGYLSAGMAYIMIGFACGLTVVIYFFQKRELFRPKFTHVTKDFRKNVSFAKWLFAGSIAHMASTQLYPWILALYHGTASTGTYGACMGVLFLANPFLIGISNFIGPKLAHAYARGGVDELSRDVLKTTALIGVVMVSFCVAILFFGNLIVVLMYGDKYGGNGAVISILALNQLAVALTMPLSNGLFAMERPDVGFKSYLLAFLVTATIGLYLVKMLGLYGVALGLLAGNITASMYRFVRYRKQVSSVSRLEVRI